MSGTGWLFRILTIALASIPVARADLPSVAEPSPASISVKGFGTLGMARSNDSDAEFVRDLSQPNGLGKHWSGKLDSLLGLQANIPLSAASEAVIQGITRYRYDGSWQPELSWAFIRHDFSPAFTVRVGRLGTEFYMQADSRLVGYANLTLRPSPDYYGPLVMSYFDGIDASLTTDTGSGLVRGKLFAGRAAEKTPFVEPLTWNLHGSRMLGGHLDYLNGPWQLRISHARIRFEHQQPLNAVAGFDIIGAAPELSVVGRRALYDSLGIAYDQGRLQVHGQASRIRYETSAYEDTYAGYLIAAYRIGPTTPYIAYSRTWSKAVDLSTPLPPPLAAAILGVTAQTHSDQHTVSLGTRWDFARNMALKAQYDRVSGKPTSRFPMRNASAQWDGEMDVLSLSLDFIF